MAGDRTGGSTVPRRRLGRELRKLREAANLTVDRAAEELERSPATIWRIETGQGSRRIRDVKDMCELYKAGDKMTEALMALATETKAKGWWHSYGDVIPETFDVYIGLEEAAEQISSYQPQLVDGLLQTEDYARVLIRADHPDEDDGEIGKRVQLRMARQAVLRRAEAPPSLDVILTELVLRCPVGGPGVMTSQLDHLAVACELPNVSLRIVPFAAGFHLGMMTGPFVVLRFPANGSGDDSEPPTVYADGYTGSLYLDKPHEVERYSAALDSIRHAALSEAESARLIKETAEELRND